MVVVAVKSVEPAVQCPKGPDAQRLFPAGHTVLVSLRLAGEGGANRKGRFRGRSSRQGFSRHQASLQHVICGPHPRLPAAVAVVSRGLPATRFTLESYSPDSVEIRSRCKLKIPAPEGVNLGRGHSARCRARRPRYQAVRLPWPPRHDVFARCVQRAQWRNHLERNRRGLGSDSAELRRCVPLDR